MATDKAPAVEYTTIRVFLADGKCLAELAERLGKTIAETYRDECAERVRRKLYAATERRLGELKDER